MQTRSREKRTEKKSHQNINKRSYTSKLNEVFLLSWVINNASYNAFEKNTDVAKMIGKLIDRSTKCDAGKKIMMVTKT